MHILIINLPDSTDRLMFQQEQLRRLELNFEVLPATSANDIQETHYQSLSRGWERPLRRSELACYLSHRKAWELVLKNNRPALILEDDALLSQHTPALLTELDTTSSCDLVTMEVRGRKKLVAKQGQDLIDDHQLLRLYQDRTGAAGYILWPSGARKLLDKAKNTAPALADAFISSTYELDACQVEPAAIVQLDQCQHYSIPNSIQTESTISSEIKPAPVDTSIIDSFTFKMRRITSQLRMGWRQLSLLSQAERRPIKLIADSFSQHKN